MHDLRQRHCPISTPTHCKKRVATAWLTHHAAAGRSSPAECVQAGWFDRSRKVLRALRGHVTRDPRPVWPAGERVADSRDNLIPLSFLDSRIVDQYEIQVAAREIASVVPVFALAKARHYEEPSCRTQNALPFRSWIK
jgi:hypothetical protein